MNEGTLQAVDSSNLQGSAPRRGRAEVVVVIVCFNGREFLDDCLSSVLRSNDDNLVKRVVVVDNASTDGSATWVREKFPQVTVLETGGNLGFSGGNNFGWQFARTMFPNANYLYLLNQDTCVEEDWLRALVDYMDQHPNVGVAQSKLLLHPNTKTVNTMGNRSHYLGFGFPTAYGEEDGKQFDVPGPINYASGAAVMVRSALLDEVGLFEAPMFMYLEDADLSWKIRQLGYEIHVVPASRVFHKYRFNSTYRYYGDLERNRWWLLLVYYRLPTLLLLAPALLLMECGQLLFAFQLGRMRDKLASYRFFLGLSNIQMICRLRRTAQARRKISDREFMKDFTDRIESPHLTSFLIRYIANPIFIAYWRLARCFQIW